MTYYHIIFKTHFTATFHILSRQKPPREQDTSCQNMLRDNKSLCKISNLLKSGQRN